MRELLLDIINLVMNFLKDEKINITHKIIIVAMLILLIIAIFVILNFTNNAIIEPAIRSITN